jgi:type VI secretion system protein ImpB
MASESSQKKKARVRPPRVHIEYEVEKNGAIVMKELPFVVGVIADLAGDTKDLPKLKDRQFERIDRDDFDKVMTAISPTLNLRVANKLTSAEGERSVALKFEKLADFSPEAVVRQDPEMAKLLDARDKLKELLARTDGNDRLEELLEEVMKNAEARTKLKEKVDEAARKIAEGNQDGTGGA